MTTFDQINRILKRRSHYRAAFQTESGKQVLADLARFCKYQQSPLVVSIVRQQVDPIATAVNIGRQEVLQRIQSFLHIDDATLLRLKDQADE